MKKKGETPTTVTGIVTPTDWDENGNVVVASVSTSSEEDYIIADNEMARGLLELSGAQVMVTGIVNNDSRGNKTITVKKFELLEEEEEEDEEEEEELLDQDELDEEFEEEEELDDEEVEDEEFEEEEFDEKH